MADMMCGLRKAAFWYLDCVKGGHVKQYCQGLQAFDSMDSRSPELLKRQQLALDNLLEHATSTTRFYGSMKGGSFADFPVVDKNVIRCFRHNGIA